MFDLHSAAVFDSHMPRRSHAVPMPFLCRFLAVPMPFPCRFRAIPLPVHEYAFMKVTSQGHGRVAAGERHGICE
jgi:hypothetical protein